MLTAVLCMEHKVIRGLLDHLQATMAPVDLDEMKRVLMELGEKLEPHRIKEQKVLLPVLASHTSYPKEDLLIAEHEQERAEATVRSLTSALAETAPGMTAVGDLIRKGREMIWQLRNHMDEEEEDVFPYAEQRLSEQVKWKAMVNMDEIASTSEPEEVLNTR